MRCSNEFDPRSTSARRSLNVRIVAMLVKAHSLMSAFVQCCCRLHDPASPTPNRSRRLKRVGRPTGTRINSIFLAKTRRSHLSMRPSAVIHKSDRAAIPPSDSNRHRRGALDETQLWAIIALLPRESFIAWRLSAAEDGRCPCNAGTLELMLGTSVAVLLCSLAVALPMAAQQKEAQKMATAHARSTSIPFVAAT